MGVGLRAVVLLLAGAAHTMAAVEVSGLNRVVVTPPIIPVPKPKLPCKTDCGVRPHGWKGFIDGGRCTSCQCLFGSWVGCKTTPCLVSKRVAAARPCGACQGKPACKVGPNGRDTCADYGTVCVHDPEGCNPYTSLCRGCCMKDACQEKRCPYGTTCKVTGLGEAECVKQCRTQCGRLRADGWRGYVDGANHCNQCSCRDGELTDCTEKACAKRMPACLEEGDPCTTRRDECPYGTECKASGGVAVAPTAAAAAAVTTPALLEAQRLLVYRCTGAAGAANPCRLVRCMKGYTCKVTAYGTARCYKGCKKTCGEEVPHGWSGQDDGGNACNKCGCYDGAMRCTKIGCPDKPCPEKCTPYTPPRNCWRRVLPLRPFATFKTAAAARTGAAVAATSAVATTEAKKLEAFPISKPGLRYCYNAGECKCGFYKPVFCLVDPCKVNSCKEGYRCKANYCGGCNYMCIKQECPRRVRKAYSLMSCSERDRFVRAIAALKAQKPSEWSDFVSMHLAAGSYAHGTSAFLPWHRWYLVGFENALRSLGGEFECITVPYWDWERDAADPANATPLRQNTFGRSVGVGAGQCVSEGVSASPGWKVSDGVSCLRRSFGGFGFTGEASMAATVTGSANYASFRPSLEGAPHAGPHIYVGGHMGTYSSPEDPLFWIHHCNVDRMWALWQDYNGYDQVPKGSTGTAQYAPAVGGVPLASVQLDSTMPFATTSGTLLPYFTNAVTIRDQLHLHDMPHGNSYSYDVDNLANQIGSPASGDWDWVIPGSAAKVNCDFVISGPIAAVVGTLFQDVDLQKDFSSGAAADIPRAENLLRVTATECKQLAEANPVTAAGKAKLEAWMELMGGKDERAFNTCPLEFLEAGRAL